MGETDLRRFIQFVFGAGLDIGGYALPVGMALVCLAKKAWIVTLGKIICAVGCILGLPGFIGSILGGIDWYRINHDKH